MKHYIILSISVLILGVFLFTSCKTKKAIAEDDPTQLAIYMLVEMKKEVLGNQLQGDLQEFEITEIKKTNKTLNQYQYTVVLKGQSSDQLLMSTRKLDYVLSANILEPSGGPAQNLESGKMKRSGPVKG